MVEKCREKTPEEIVAKFDELEDEIRKTTERQIQDLQQHFSQQMEEIYRYRSIEILKLVALRGIELDKCPCGLKSICWNSEEIRCVEGQIGALMAKPKPDADDCACSCDQETCRFDAGPSASFTRPESGTDSPSERPSSAECGLPLETAVCAPDYYGDETFYVDGTPCSAVLAEIVKDRERNDDTI